MILGVYAYVRFLSLLCFRVLGLFNIQWLQLTWLAVGSLIQCCTDCCIHGSHSMLVALWRKKKRRGGGGGGLTRDDS